MKQVVTVAAIQAKPVSETFDDMMSGADVPHALELLRQAAAQGADIACFPEAYPRVGEAEICAAARELGLHVVAGLREPAAGERWYNTATFISPEGRIIGRQRKLYPTSLELRGGAVRGERYEVFETEVGRLGAIICSDFAFFDHGVKELKARGVDILFNPALWFALGEAYSATVIGRHMEYGVPVIGVDMAVHAFRRRIDGELQQLFPPAGDHTTVTVTPPVARLDDLGEWFRTKPGGVNSMEGFVWKLGEAEGILTAQIDLAAVRAFPGYFYYEAEPSAISDQPSAVSRQRVPAAHGLRAEG